LKRPELGLASCAAKSRFVTHCYKGRRETRK
jgi:hypothetical protein